MKKNAIYKIILGGMLLTGVSTVGHIYYKDCIEKNYDKKDAIIDLAGITFASGCACYSGSRMINTVAKNKKNKLEANLTD